MTKAFANTPYAGPVDAPLSPWLALVCPIDSLADLRAAVDNGADCVCITYRYDASAHLLSNSCLPSGYLAKGIRYAHDNGCKVLIKLDAQSDERNWRHLSGIIDRATSHGVDALQLADTALLLYAATRHPIVRRHYLAPTSILDKRSVEFLHIHFGITRIVLRQMLSLSSVMQWCGNSKLELEIPCSDTSLLTQGGDEISRDALNKQRCISTAGINGGSTSIGLCGGNDDASNDGRYQVPRTSFARALRLLPKLAALGIHAFSIETPAHRPIDLAQTVRIWREAIDDCLDDLDRFTVKPSWIRDLDKLVG